MHRLTRVQRQLCLGLSCSAVLGMGLAAAAAPVWASSSAAASTAPDIDWSALRTTPEVQRAVLLALETAANDRANHPFKTAVFATGSATRGPSARRVVLRHFSTKQIDNSPAAGLGGAALVPGGGLPTLTAWSSLHSQKVEDLKQNERPVAEWVFWDAIAQVQVRCRGPTEVHYKDSVTEGFWKTTTRFQRTAYARDSSTLPLPAALLPSQPAPATASKQPCPPDSQGSEAEEEEEFYANFAVLQTRVERMDVVLLARPPLGNRRVIFGHEDLLGQAGRPAPWTGM
eukprot:g26001.t1